jgi:hypothetical protein
LASHLAVAALAKGAFTLGNDPSLSKLVYRNFLGPGCAIHASIVKTALNVRCVSLRKAKATAIHSEHHTKGSKADYPGGTFAQGFHSKSPL